MNLFGFNISRSSANQKSKIENQKSAAALSWLRDDSSDTTASLLTNPYQQVVWVYRAINAIAEQVANIPFLFSAGERGRENLITTGPLHDFYNRPHPHISRFQYWELRIIWLMLRGECVRIPIFDSSASGMSSIKNQNSKIKNILILDPANFQHIIRDQELIGWRYTAQGPNAPLESQLLLPEEVWFEKLPNPFDFWRGMSPLQVAATAAGADLAASSFMKGIMENNGDPGLIVRTEDHLTEDQHLQIATLLRQRKRRAGAADRPLFLWGASEIIRPQLSSADLQFLENRKFSRAEICAAFGVPEEILTTTDTAKYDVMAQARLNFIENRIAPLCARLEAEENATTIPAIVGRDPRQLTTGWFDLDSHPLMQQSRRDRLATAKTGFDMGIPFNELNRALDLGFKPLPWGNIGYLPSKYQPLPRIPEDRLANPARHRRWQS